MQANITQDMIKEFRRGIAPANSLRLSDSEIRSGLDLALAMASDCLACPKDCGECSNDRTCCECYTHQEMHPDTRAEEALQALHDQARGGRVTEASIRRIARHFGFEEPR